MTRASPRRRISTASRAPSTTAWRTARTALRTRASSGSASGPWPIRGSRSTTAIVTTESAAGSAVSSSDFSGPTPSAMSVPMTATATKFTELLMRKNATDRRAIWSAGIPARLRIHAPSARPPAPLAGSSEPTASSDQPISQLVRHEVEAQNTGRNIATYETPDSASRTTATASQAGLAFARRSRTLPRPGASAAIRPMTTSSATTHSARRTSRRVDSSSGSSIFGCSTLARPSTSGVLQPRGAGSAGGRSGGGRRERRDRVEPADDALGEPRVVPEVEQLVEVEPEGAGGEQLAQMHAGVPRPLGVLLDDPVRLVARVAALDEREQHALGEERAVRDVEVRAHPVGMHDQAAHDADREVVHVVEQDRRVGQDDPLGARVRDVALVPQRDVLDARLRVPAQHAREAADALAHDRVALVRHRARALLLPRAERLLGLADLGALEVADLGREALEPGAGESDRLQQRRVAVARDDLGRHRLGRERQAREHARLEVGVGRAVRADGAAQRADRRLCERLAQPLRVALGLEREPGELDAERRRLGLHAVGAPDAHRLDVLARALGQRADELLGAGDDDLAGGADLERQRGVEHVGRRQPEVDPAARRAGALAEHVDERGDVVVGDALALLDGLDGERRAADRLEVGGGRPRHLLARRDLHAAPRLHARLVGPQRADLRAGVAVDHSAIVSMRAVVARARRSKKRSAAKVAVIDTTTASTIAAPATNTAPLPLAANAFVAIEPTRPSSRPVATRHPQVRHHRPSTRSLERRIAAAGASPSTAAAWAAK